MFDKDNKEVENLTADENDKAISEPLCFGKFTLEEIQAPNSSTLFKDLIEGKVLSSVQK
ncbi:SpaA isopeptide-forming pilin-related protein [Bacillus mycoides]|uniref:SpaA isopeptide-forming pilin-related protein n=1 Tax=Bacillus mycoides TaxID=1405 RepID=UPI00187A9FC4